MSTSKQRLIWTCLAVFLSAKEAYPMVMDVSGDQIILSGEVAQGDLFKFNSLLDQNRGITTVILRDSPGGHAPSGYDIGATIRNRGLRTAVSGYCRSSCSRMFLGGVERHFADDQRVGLTYVAFHGNYEKDGRLQLWAMEKLQKFIVDYSDGKADRELVRRWTTLPNNRGFIYFFDSNRLRRPDGASTFLCSGTESGPNKYDQCERISKTGYELGIYTSTMLIKPNR